MIKIKPNVIRPQNYDDTDVFPHPCENTDSEEMCRRLIPRIPLHRTEMNPRPARTMRPAGVAHVCNICGKMLAHSYPLPISEVCLFQEAYHCHCGKVYYKKTSYKHHLTIYCGKEKKFECPFKQCSYKSKLKTNLKRHMLQHQKMPQNPDPFIIERGELQPPVVLQQDFLEFDQILVPPTLEKLLDPSGKSPKKHKEHRNSIKKFADNIVRPGYSPDSQFACRHCGKRYKWKSTMRRHEQDECGDQEPKFQCPLCPYKAKQKGNLRVHIKKHHPIGSAAAAFVQEEKSDINQNVLLEKTAIACPKCNKKYKNVASMRSHYSHDCREKIEYVCNICQYTTKRKYSFRLHLVRKHNSIISPEGT
ncbi:zinc finger protein OZF-like [Diabrotica virgifera virgifera]|uniref:C2H2-type domain-containing protein n=1 Tax=Diabrotica virgifera virgifera TaxID=50390 RepID=A0ABM5JZU2_DIAVI|nr:zinc finger protein OZF-like [Diabrotica virgifera virgifera]